MNPTRILAEIDLRLARSCEELDKENFARGNREAILLQLIETNNLYSSLRMRGKNFSKLEKIERVLFVGSSFVGKSTLVDMIRLASYEDERISGRISVPKRVITRPPRENDNLVENIFCSSEEFEKMVEDGKIEIQWVRKMEGDRKEKYGFLTSDRETIPVYSANNAVINNKESVKPYGFLKNALIVAVYAPDSLRKKRLSVRSPDLIQNNPEEVAYRLSDRAINMYPEAHIIIKNFGKYEKRTKSDLISLMRLLAY